MYKQLVLDSVVSKRNLAQVEPEFSSATSSYMGTDSEEAIYFHISSGVACSIVDIIWTRQ